MILINGKVSYVLSNYTYRYTLCDYEGAWRFAPFAPSETFLLYISIIAKRIGFFFGGGCIKRTSTIIRY